MLSDSDWGGATLKNRSGIPIGASLSALAPRQARETHAPLSHTPVATWGPVATGGLDLAGENFILGFRVDSEWFPCPLGGGGGLAAVASRLEPRLAPAIALLPAKCQVTVSHAPLSSTTDLHWLDISVAIVQYNTVSCTARWN
jgi:hypothetical protein